MKSSEFLKNKLSALYEKYPHCKIRYEYRAHSNSHLIEVLPIEFFNSSNYMDDESEIDDEFTLNYPNENLIFLSKESLNKITNPIFEWGIPEENNVIHYKPVKIIDQIAPDLDLNDLFQFNITNTERINININISAFDNKFLLAEDMISGDNLVDVKNNNYALAA